MNEEEMIDRINEILAFMKEELKAKHSCFNIKQLLALQGLKEKNERLVNNEKIYKELISQAQDDVKIWKNLYNQEKQKNKKLEEVIDMMEEDLLHYNEKQMNVKFVVITANGDTIKQYYFKKARGEE